VESNVKYSNMKKFFLILLPAFMLAVIILTGCQKYDKGPFLSIEPKKWRVANTWKVEKFLWNNSDSTVWFTTVFPNFEETFDRKGNYSYKGYPLDGTGNWQFEKGKERIKRFNISGQPSSSDIITILKLKEKEFWYTKTVGTELYELHMVPK
jgi:hypothetical protein